MVESVGGHRLDDGDVVHNFGQMRQRFGQFCAALPVIGKFEFGREQRRVRLDEGVFLPHHDLWRNRLAIVLGERRLVIEQVKLARGAPHEKVDHTLRLRIEMRLARRKRIYCLRHLRSAKRFARAEQRR
ncbi:MAG: hypothetical protein DME26_09625 [Verrucomicrobia bacterium]|nr:MAG: hypothetical protein DME26_09625 [Verrucomicrobiota bacterium]